MKLKSNFAILDVLTGRQKLLKIVGSRWLASAPITNKKVPVVIHGFVTEAHGDDDGTSREFEVMVNKIEVGDPVDK